jgi:DNA recombination protein RmuC
MEAILLGVIVVLLVLLVVRRAPAPTLVAPAPAYDPLVAEKLTRLEGLPAAVDDLRFGVRELQAYTQARHDLERRTAASIARLEAVIAGTHSKGAAGESILEVAFSQLPPEWQVRDFVVGNRVVEFGLRLPNGLVPPIDSKWPATDLIERFAASDDIEEQRRLKAQIEAAVLQRASELRKYLDPNLTVNFAIAAVPDAVFELSAGAQAQAFRMNVVVLGYGMFLPYLLLVFQSILGTTRSVDLQQLDAYLDTVNESLEAVREELEGRFARAVTMLANSRSDMSAQVSRATAAHAGLQLSAPTEKSAEPVEESLAWREPGDV